MSLDPTAIHDRIRQLRDARGWSEREMCLRAGVGVDVVRDFRRRGAMPRIDTIYALADALGCSLDYLVSGRGEPQTSLSDQEAALVNMYRRVDSSQQAMVRRLLDPGDEPTTKNINAG